MSLNDPLANALSHILNSEKRGKQECMIENTSSSIKILLELLREKGYLGDIESIETNQGEHLKIQLVGAINKCGAIKPRFAVKKDNYSKFEKRYLPARDFGFLIVSTNQGLMTHQDALEKGLGGKLIAYCY